MQNFSDGKVPVKDNKAVSLVAYAKQVLEQIYNAEEAGVIVYWLLEHVTGIKKNELVINNDVTVQQSALIRFCNGVDDLIKGKPIQYITGETEFYGLILGVNPSVLIPRPETEELAEMIVKTFKDTENLRVLDIGTGSGCLAIALAKYLPGSKVTAIDISREALETAKKNAVKNQVTGIEFLEVDFLEEDCFLEREFDLMVSNPPYIKTSEKNNMHKNVVDFEPHTALFVPDEDALIFYHKIAETGTRLLKKKGCIFVEINEKLGEETLHVFEKYGYKSSVLIKDMSVNNRFIKAAKT